MLLVSTLHVNLLHHKSNTIDVPRYQSNSLHDTKTESPNNEPDVEADNVTLSNII